MAEATYRVVDYEVLQMIPIEGAKAAFGEIGVDVYLEPVVAMALCKTRRNGLDESPGNELCGIILDEDGFRPAECSANFLGYIKPGSRAPTQWFSEGKLP
jgi:hypothetical protein